MPNPNRDSHLVSQKRKAFSFDHLSEAKRGYRKFGRFWITLLTTSYKLSRSSNNILITQTKDMCI